MIDLTPGASNETAVTTDRDTTRDTTYDTTKDTAIEVPAITKETSGKQSAQAIERAREVGGPLEAPQPALGGGEPPRRVLLICLDGAMPGLALDTWRSHLRMFDRLAERGVWGRLRSSVPWTSMPARLCLLSGQDPGQLGVYGPRRRTSYRTVQQTDADGQAIQEPRIWDIVGGGGRRVGVIAGQAAPAPTGARVTQISDAPAPGSRTVTFPPALAPQVDQWLEDASLKHLPAPADMAGQLIQSAYLRTEQRFLLARRLLARETYDCFVLADDGIATVQRALWHTLDSSHPRYAPDHPDAGAIGSFYRFVDDLIAELLEMVDSDTIVAVASAHGSEALRGDLALNEWLLASGDLALRSPPPQPTALEHCDIDWARTRAWAADSGAIYLNVAGRDPEGHIPAEQAALYSASLAERLRALRDPGGAPALEVYRPSALYAATKGICPDLLAACALPGWRLTDTLGHGDAWVPASGAQPEAACDSPTGFLLLYDPHSPGGGRQIDEHTIYDVAPTLLQLLNQPSPRRMRGHAIAVHSAPK